MIFIHRILIFTVLLIPGSVFSSIPGQVNFQGVLLDNTNQVVSGSINFNFSLFDNATGGTQLWSESQPGVTVSAGIYTVVLGSVVPLTTETLSNGAVYLEVSVGGEILLPRKRLLAVPYALKAEDAENIAGIPGGFIEQLYQHIDYDGQSIANNDPREGVADVDGDGLANFIDPDNDGDGFVDNVEVSNGTGVNLITPLISSIANEVGSATGRAGEAKIMTITGSGFLAGLTIQVGAENPTPQNLTSTSFEITVGMGQSEGNTAVTVTNPNAEVATSSMYFFDGNAKLVFVTSALMAGGLIQPISVVDAFCTQSAADAGLTGSYVGWYSDPANSISAKDRLPSVGGPWVRTDGVVVANGLSDLIDGSIAASISLNEYGSAVFTTSVATKTFASGDFDPNNCSGTSPSSGYVGSAISTDEKWTYNSTTYCSSNQHFYCFEQ